MSLTPEEHLLAFRRGLEQCDAACTAAAAEDPANGGSTAYQAAERAFEKFCSPPLLGLLHSPLLHPLDDTTAPSSCCDPAILECRSEMLVGADDVKLFTVRAVTARLKAFIAAGGTGGATNAPAPTAKSGLRQKKQTKREREADAAAAAEEAAAMKKGKKGAAITASAAASAAAPVETSAVPANAYALLYGVTFGSDSAGVRFETLVSEKRRLEKSEQYSVANSSERRALQLKSVLAVFSARAHKQSLAALWAAFLAVPQLPPQLQLHFLTSVGTHVLPHISNPVSLADYLITAFSQGGLVAVLALQGVFLLMLDHGLEYPAFYAQLYSLVTPDAFSSRHRYQLFRLVNVSLTSLRVPATIVAAFAKRTARCLLSAPMPTLYFGLPFLRQLLQRHQNCLALIHRRPDEAELFEDDEHADDDDIGPQDAAAAARVASLFAGHDPFDNSARKPEKSHAIDSTLWELTLLEKHFLPGVSLMVSAFASTAQDNQPLKFEKTYARLFAHEITKHTKGEANGSAVVAYQAPAEKLLASGHKEVGMTAFVA